MPPQPRSALPVHPDGGDAHGISRQNHTQAMSRAESLQLEIVTAEGDRVTLTLANERALHLVGSQVSTAAAPARDADAAATAGSATATLDRLLSALDAVTAESAAETGGPAGAEPNLTA
jgi:hypothetical protein